LRDPEAAAGLEDRIERGDEAARGHDRRHLAVALHVFVGLAVAEHDERIAAEPARRVRGEALAGPDLVALDDLARAHEIPRAGGAERRGEVLALLDERVDRDALRRRLVRVAHAEAMHPSGEAAERI